MTPERKEFVNGKLIEEYYWAGNKLVYVDHYLTSESYEEAVARLHKEKKRDKE